jgi:hypothetical protein
MPHHQGIADAKAYSAIPYAAKPFGAAKRSEKKAQHL